MSDITDITKTYCNPIPLPDYPIGRKCYDDDFPKRTYYRETADPTVIYEGGKWYLYPSCGMVYYTEDFIHWKHHKMEPYDCGYAPTVVKHNDRFWLLACSSELYVSDSPLGDFTSVGALRSVDGEDVYVDDPMLFSDDDGQLYLYCGCGGAISAARLDANNPRQLITPLTVMFSADTEHHVWERMGEWNEDDSYSWTEGAWMYKRGDTYYLTYSAPGTEWCTYAMGAYKSSGPMGPWEYMKSSPFLKKRDGLVRGPGHGCIVPGPNDTLWVFYTCCMCYGGKFERRIGYDPLGIDDKGDLYAVATEIPQLAPGILPKPEQCNAFGIVPLTQNRRECFESSAAPGRDGCYAVDDSMLTWWQPAPEDEHPTLEVQMSAAGLEIYSARIIWRDVGLDIKKEFLPGAFKYRIDALNMDDEWVTVLDKSENREDMCIDYNPIEHIRAKSVRLCILGAPEHIAPGVVNFTVFGSNKPIAEK